MTPSASERKRARRIVGFVGLILWASGVTVSAVLALQAVGGVTTVAGGALVSAIMLGAIALSVETGESPDPVARAWWLLTLYAVFPAATASWSLSEAGLAHGHPALLSMAAILPALLSLRAALLVSAGGARFLGVETGLALPRAGARRMATLFALLYAITAAAVLAAALAGWRAVAFGALVLGFVALRVAAYVIRRALLDAGHAPAATPSSAPR